MENVIVATGLRPTVCFHLQIERFQDFFLSNPKKQLLCPSFLATRPPADRAESIFLNVTWIAAGGHGPGVLNPP